MFVNVLHIVKTFTKYFRRPHITIKYSQPQNRRMKDITLQNWENFEKEVKKLQNDHATSKFLYRGQEEHSFNLLTTLERNGQQRLSLKEYHRLISAIKPQIESFTRSKWNILSYPHGIEEWLKQNAILYRRLLAGQLSIQNTYSYMTYLRHYGFPSPFLDWTSSPYIAAYFAFRQPLQGKNNISIYVYAEPQSRARDSKYPFIHTFGPYVTTDPRHFLQQSQYTVSMIYDNEWLYVPHEDTFAQFSSTDQECLWKFNIPNSERLKVLKYLDGYNINAYSLFGSDESLMETMTLREIHFNDMI